MLIGDLQSAAADALMGQAGRERTFESRQPQLARALRSVKEARECKWMLLL